MEIFIGKSKHARIHTLFSFCLLYAETADSQVRFLFPFFSFSAGLLLCCCVARVPLFSHSFSCVVVAALLLRFSRRIFLLPERSHTR